MAGWQMDADFHYIWHPGGNVANLDVDKTSGTIKDAAVLTLHTSLKYEAMVPPVHRNRPHRASIEGSGTVCWRWEGEHLN
jgi:hypothetical protein